MSTSPIRVRFAPAPTGLMHLGNVRTALMNFLFARQRNGIFIIRVEDTDQQRNFDPGAKQIMADLAWLNLHYNEGPEMGGPHAPYFQSERTPLYREKLDELIKKGGVYRCFCTEEELEKKRQRQVALKLPPRYDRACLALKPEVVQERLAANTPFVWRLKMPQEGSVEISDIARGSVTFEFKNFSDQPLTRADGSITFLFANFVDDLEMRITHVFRGEDHLTNTAIQAVMYQAFGAQLPTYWHMPILCNSEGKKLSKRDFGFSLNDLRQAGYLPEAICNYLAHLGGASFEHEIMSLEELAQKTDFTNFSTAGQIKYDVEKLSWLNHKWIEKLDPQTLARHCKPFVQATFPAAKDISDTVLSSLLQIIKSDLKTLRDTQQALHFYFERPHITDKQLAEYMPLESSKALAAIIGKHLPTLSTIEPFMQALKTDAKAANIPMKQMFAFLRLALMAQAEGPGIHDLIAMLGVKEAEERIKRLCVIAG